MTFRTAGACLLGLALLRPALAQILRAILTPGTGGKIGTDKGSRCSADPAGNGWKTKPRGLLQSAGAGRQLRP